MIYMLLFSNCFQQCEFKNKSILYRQRSNHRHTVYALYLSGLGRGHAKRRFVVLERPITCEFHRIGLCVLSVEANQLISRKRSPQAPMMQQASEQARFPSHHCWLTSAPMMAGVRALGVLSRVTSRRYTLYTGLKDLLIIENQSGKRYWKHRIRYC